MPEQLGWFNREHFDEPLAFLVDEIDADAGFSVLEGGSVFVLGFDY